MICFGFPLISFWRWGFEGVVFRGEMHFLWEKREHLKNYFFVSVLLGKSSKRGKQGKKKEEKQTIRGPGALLFKFQFSLFQGLEIREEGFRLP